jgi:hypothetical protein
LAIAPTGCFDFMKTSIFRRLPARTSSWAIVRGCFIAVAFCAIAWWLALAAKAHLTRTPLAPLYLAVFFTVLVGNTRYGLLSCLLTGLCAWFYVLPAVSGRPQGLGDLLALEFISPSPLGRFFWSACSRKEEMCCRKNSRN